MKDPAILVNVSRGEIIDESALIQALDEQEIASVGLDVLQEKPPSEDAPLRGHPRSVITSHIAGYSEEANVERRQRDSRAQPLLMVPQTGVHLV